MNWRLCSTLRFQTRLSCSNAGNRCICRSREAEIKRLDWSEVDQRRGHIEVKSSKAKSARRRIVEMQPNLRDWLRPYAGMTGAIVPVNARKKLDTIRKDCWISALAEERASP